MASERTGATEKARMRVDHGAASGLLERLAERIGARASVEAVFGAPLERGDLTIVPVARVRWGLGAGGGASEADGASGSGGGGGVAADPVGYLEITTSGATFRSIERPLARPGFMLAMAIGIAIVLRSFAALRR